MVEVTKYSEAIGDEICRRIADGESLRTVCRDASMPSRTAVMNWLADEKREAFKRRYDIAREEMAHALFEDMRDIADDGRNDFICRFEDEQTTFNYGLALQTADGDYEIVCRLSEQRSTGGLVADMNGDGYPDLVEDDVVPAPHVLVRPNLLGRQAACPADLNKDFLVGFDDLLTLLAFWGPCPYERAHSS